MKQEGAAHFEEVRIRNRRLLRNLMRDFSQVGKTELAKLSGLSIPTVTAGLKDLMDLGEVLELVGTVSNGGRPGALYSLNPDYQYAACGYLEETAIYMEVRNVFGEVVEKFEQALDIQTSVADLLQVFEGITSRYTGLSILVLGIPGVIWQGRIEHLPCFPNLQGIHLQEVLEQSLGIQILIENDVNTLAYAQSCQYQSFAHIFLSQGCIGAGLMINGQLVRGAHGCAGELEHVCRQTGDIYDYLCQAICIVACVADVPYIFLSGKDTYTLDEEELTRYLKKRLPEKRMPQIKCLKDEQVIYKQGLWKMALDEWKMK